MEIKLTKLKRNGCYCIRLLNPNGVDIFYSNSITNVRYYMAKGFVPLDIESNSDDNYFGVLADSDNDTRAFKYSPVIVKVTQEEFDFISDKLVEYYIKPIPENSFKIPDNVLEETFKTEEEIKPKRGRKAKVI